jgi:UrcA family protein
MIKMATPKLPLMIAAAATALSLSVPAHAGLRTTEVSVNDLDLSRPSAQQRLDDRIKRAVRKVCRSHVAANLGERQDVAECEANARADAEAQKAERIASHKESRRAALKSRLKVASD